MSNNIRDRINEIFNPAEIQQIVDSYLELYYGSNLTAKLSAESAETQFSRDENEWSRALRRGEMVNGFRDLINWHQYYKKILDNEYNPMYYDDAISYMRLGGSLLTLRMKRNGEWEVIKMEDDNNVYILEDNGSVVRRPKLQNLAGQRKGNLGGNGVLLKGSKGNPASGTGNNQKSRNPKGSNSSGSANNSGNVPINNSKDTDTSSNRGSAIYIKDGHTEDGKTVDFLFLLVLCYNCFVY